MRARLARSGIRRLKFLNFGFILCIATGFVSSARAQIDVPDPGPGTCREGCGNQPIERDRPEHPPGWHPYFPNPEQQALSKGTADFRASIDRLNGFIDSVNAGSRFDQSVRDSVLTIFGGSQHFAPAQSDDIQSLESDVRSFVQSYPGLSSAALYQGDMANLASRIAAIEDRIRQQRTLRQDIADWYARHPGPVTDAEYESAVAERVQKIDELVHTTGRLLDEARSFARRADAAEMQALQRLHLPRPTSSGGDEMRLEAASTKYARDRVPASLEEANLERYSIDALVGSQPKIMPDWAQFSGATAQIAPWYATYSQQTAFADIVPQPPGPNRQTAQPASPEQARADVAREIMGLSDDIGRLSDAVGAYSDKHRQWSQAEDEYMSQAHEIGQSAQPALRSMHIEALNAYFDDEKRAYFKRAYDDIYESVRAVFWENIAHQASQLAELPDARRKAMHGAVLLVPSVKNLARDEFKEIMQGPMVLAHGDAAEAAALDAKIQSHVCEFMSGGLPWMDEEHLPAFIRPAVSSASCKVH